MFRMFVDFPITTNEEDSIHVAKKFAELLEQNREFFTQHGVVSLGYRLGNDEDRQKSNYLDKNKNGHVSSRKFVLDFSSTNTTI